MIWSGRKWSLCFRLFFMLFCVWQCALAVLVGVRDSRNTETRGSRLPVLTLSITTLPLHFLWLAISGNHVSVGKRAPDTMKDLFVWRLRGQRRGRAEKIHNIRPKKSMWLLLLVLLEHGNDKIIGQWSSSPSLCLICCCPADPWKLACQTFSWSEILMMLQNIGWDRLISDENGVQKTKHLAVNYLRASVCLQPGRSCHFQSSVYCGLSTIAPWNPQEKHSLFAFNWKVV